MADKVLDVRHVVDSMVSPEGLQAGGGEPIDAYTKEECDERFAPKVTQTVKGTVIEENTSATAIDLGSGDYSFQKLNAVFDTGNELLPVYKFYGQFLFPAHPDAGTNSHSYYFDLPEGVELPSVGAILHDQLYVAGLNQTIQYDNASTGGRGFALGAISYNVNSWDGCDVLIASHAANSDVATGTQFKIILSKGSQANTNAFRVNVEFAIALKETE